MSGLDDLRDLGRIVQADVIEAGAAAVVEDVRGLLSSGLDKFAHRTPYLTGWARGSVMPYTGVVPDDVPAKGKPFYPVAGDPEVDAAMAGFELGQPAGLVSNAPHVPRLAEGWSKQQPAGWVDVIAEELAIEPAGEKR